MTPNTATGMPPIREYSERATSSQPLSGPQYGRLPASSTTTQVARQSPRPDEVERREDDTGVESVAFVPTTVVARLTGAVAAAAAIAAGDRPCSGWTRHEGLAANDQRRGR